MLIRTLRNGAGLDPSLCNNESSDKKRSSKIRHGNSYLKKCLCRPAFTVKKSPREPIITNSKSTWFTKSNHCPCMSSIKSNFCYFKKTNEIS
ncbi:TPA: transposase [Streptococcus suis]